MSSEGSSNPLWTVVEKDKFYASRFNDIAQGKISGEVTARIGTINNTIELEKSTQSFLEFAKSIDSSVSESEWLKRVEKAGGLSKFLKDLASGKGDRLFSFEKVLYSKNVGQALMSSKKAEKFLEFWMDLPSNLKNSTQLSKWAAKASKYIGNSKIVLGIFGNKFVDSSVKIGEKFLKSDFSKKALKYGAKTVVWGVIVTDIGYSAYKNWNSKDTDSKTTAGKIGKSVVGTAIDQIKNVGPLSGMWAGSKIGGALGGPPGAAIGMIIGGVSGAVNQIGQFVAPKLYDKGIKWLKATSYNVIDKIEGKVLEVGKGIKKTGESIKSIGKNVSNFFSGGQKLASSWFG